MDEQFLQALRAFLAFLRSTNSPNMIIGGLAASLLGQTRLTQDIDGTLLLQQESFEKILATAAEYGFEWSEPQRLDTLC